MFSAFSHFPILGMECSKLNFATTLIFNYRQNEEIRVVWLIDEENEIRARATGARRKAMHRENKKKVQIHCLAISINDESWWSNIQSTVPWNQSVNSMNNRKSNGTSQLIIFETAFVSMAMNSFELMNRMHFLKSCAESTIMIEGVQCSAYFILIWTLDPLI